MKRSRKAPAGFENKSVQRLNPFEKSLVAGVKTVMLAKILGSNGLFGSIWMHRAPSRTSTTDGRRKNRRPLLQAIFRH
jgi:hypothetical protein